MPKLEIVRHYTAYEIDAEVKLCNSQVCTFQLIVKNASSLLADKDPIKLEAEAKLTDLIR